MMDKWVLFNLAFNIYIMIFHIFLNNWIKRQGDGMGIGKKSVPAVSTFHLIQSLLTSTLKNYNLLCLMQKCIPVFRRLTGLGWLSVRPAFWPLIFGFGLMQFQVTMTLNVGINIPQETNFTSNELWRQICVALITFDTNHIKWISRYRRLSVCQTLI